MTLTFREIAFETKRNLCFIEHFKKNKETLLFGKTSMNIKYVVINVFITIKNPQLAISHFP